MIRLISRLALADVRSAPARVAAVAVLLASASWLPSLLDADRFFGILLSFTIAFSATAGAVALDERRSRLLEHNGARPRSLSTLAAASMVVPGTLAVLLATAARLVLPDGRQPSDVVLTSLVVPVFAAAVAAGHRSGARRGRVHGVARAAGLVVLVLVVLLLPLLGVALAALRLSAGAWSTSRTRRGAGAALAVLVIGASIALIGSSRSWDDLALVLAWVVPGLAVAVVAVGIQAVAVGARLAARTGPRARLALAPLTGRRRALVPVVGMVSLVTTLAVTESIVGASFGEREANRERDLPTITAPAGNRPDQAIATVPPVDVAALRAVADQATAGTAATAVVVEQVGLGAPVSGAVFGLPLLLQRGRLETSFPFQLPGVWIVPADPGRPPGDAPTVDTTDASVWIGVVAPEHLAALGWGSAVDALAGGQVVLTSGLRPQSDGAVDVVVGEQVLRRPAVAVDGPTGGKELPGGLVSDATAAELTPVRTAARVIVVPTPGAADRPTTDELLAIADSIRDAASELPALTPEGLGPEEQSAFDLYRSLLQSTATSPVLAGDDRLVVWSSGPLNDVPGFAATAAEGRSRLLGLAVLPVLAIVAGVLLALGATRPDDLVLEVQGAPRRLRSLVSAIQAGVVAISATLVAAALGVGVPALAFRRYNQGADLPDIPLVVPGLVWAVLALTPVAAVALSAVIPLVGRGADGGRRDRDLLDGLVV